MAATLLSYFRDGVKREGLNPKYLNRDFLNTYLREYHESVKRGSAYYPDTLKTDFYNKNSYAYCVFLELHYEYEKGMQHLRKLSA